MSTQAAASGQGQQRAALFSVGAAAFLIALKLVTGLVTGSLGLVAEAAHSGTDLVAALLTLFAIRVALRPADREHHYGHGKAEHLAALAESSFLFVVSGFLAYLAVRRLGGAAHHVDATWWSFAVLAVVIAIDASRATLSLRASRRFHSPALASNALHFASDLAGSVAVLVGLVFVASGKPDGDAVATLVVAGLVMGAAGRMAGGSAQVLMDRASAEAEAAVRRALETLGGGVEVRRVRLRQAAGKDFVDMIVGLRPDAGLTQAHTTADAIEDAVEAELPGADVIVHVEPAASSSGDLRERATVAALSVPEVREVHNVRAMHVDGAFELSLHVKLPRALSLGAAHDVVERLEAAILGAVPEVRTVHTHIEPLSQVDWASRPEQDEVAEQRAVIDEIVRRITGRPPAEIHFRDGEHGRVALISILLPANEPLPSAHRRAGRIEEALRQRCPEISEVVVHTEPIPAAQG